MRTAPTTVLLLVLTVSVFAQTTALSPADDAAIRRIVQQQDDARNRGDWKALAELFTEDAEQFTSAGEWRRGRASIEQRVAESMKTVYKGSKYVSKVETIRLVTPTVALADGSFEITNIASGGSRRGHTTYVLVKSADRWRIAAVRSMVPTAVGVTPSR